MNGRAGHGAREAKGSNRYVRVAILAVTIKARDTFTRNPNLQMAGIVFSPQKEQNAPMTDRGKAFLKISCRWSMTTFIAGQLQVLTATTAPDVNHIFRFGRKQSITFTPETKKAPDSMKMNSQSLGLEKKF